MAVMTDEVTRNEAALLGYLEAHDSAFLAEDATFTDVTTGLSWTGPDAIGGMLSWMYHGVFEAHVEDTRIILGADGIAAVAEMMFVGRHQGDFAGVPATGREVRVPLVVVYDMADGRITGARVHFSVAAFQAQMAS
jgi:predicted ester cyclase